MYDTIVFDLDGTLLDTLYDLYVCTNDILKKYDCPQRSFQEVRQFVGNGIKKLIERALPEKKQDLLESLSLYYKVVVLGEDLGSLLEE